MKKVITLVLTALLMTTIGCSNTSIGNKNNKTVESKALSEKTKKNNKNNKDKIVQKETTTEKTDISEESNIVRHPSPADYYRGNLNSLPYYDLDSKDPFKMDLRSYDLSNLNIEDRLDDLMYADFDSKTKWPENLPSGYNPNDIIELGKNPGLRVRTLHDKGITGKGIGIGIIDQQLLVDHVEYKDNLKMYEEIHCQKASAQMHGPAVASIAVGKSVGAAPDADLYYIAERHGDYKNNEFIWDFTWVAKSIDRLLEVNKDLPEDEKIRVISISVGWDKSQKGYDEVMDAVEKATEAGIFVVSSSLFETHNLFFHGLGREPLNNPNDANSYDPGLWWAKKFFEIEGSYNNYIAKVLKERDPEVNFDPDKVILVPMDSRTTASPTGNEDYVFYRNGGWSWSIPYIAGVYALACQVDPEITPEVFWNIAAETGKTITIEKDNKNHELGKIIDPVELINALQAK